MDLLPRSEAAGRLAWMQTWMDENAADAVFISQNADLYYFAGTIQAGLLCLPAAGEPVYLVQKSPSRARTESPWERIIPTAGLRKAPDMLAGEGIARLRRVGLEFDVLPVSHYLRIRNLFPQVEFVDATEAIRKVRMIKSAHEVEQIRKAARMLQIAFAEIPGWALPGATELEISARLECFLREHGHQGIIRARAFNFELFIGVLSAGPSAAYPTSFPGPVGCRGLYAAIPGGAGLQPLVPGQTLMVDVVGGYGGYLADKTRTFAIGEVAAELRRAHGFVLDLMREIEMSMKPGILCSQIYELASRRIAESPYGPKFMGVGDSQVRFVGHGLGLEIDEYPVLAANFDMPLESGMTIAVEPKIFFPDGGVGIENTYLVTEQGAEKLTLYPEEMLAIAI